MALSSYERGDTFKTTVEWKSGSTYIDPSSNMSYLDITAPDGTSYLSESGSKRSTGMYDYYVSTSTSDNLGIYKIRWHALFNYGSPWNYNEESNAFEIWLTDVD